MKITNITVPEAILADLSTASREEAVVRLVTALGRSRGVDVEVALRDIATRERAGPTIIPVNSRYVALPHASTTACRQLVIGMGLSSEGLVWNGSSLRAHVIFVILGPPQAHVLHLRALGRIATLCQKEGLLDSLLTAASPPEALRILSEAESQMGEIVAGDGMPSFCVLGAGHGGMAMASHLALTGCRVNLFNRTPARIESIRARGGIEVDGEVNGFAPLNAVTTDPAEALDDCDVLMVVVPATGHREMARIVAPHLKDGQILILNPGRTGGALEVAAVLKRENPYVHPYIGEAQTLLYAARVTNPGQVHIFGVKNSVPLATLPTYDITDILPVIRRALPQFVPGDNVLKTSLDNIGAVFHPAITVLNAARIEDTHGDFEYYVEGVTPSVARTLEAIDAERVAVAEALGIRVNTAREWLYLAYDAAGKTLHDAMKANAGYSGIKAPMTIQHRYVSEDVPASLVPIASLGEMLNVPTPTISSIIRLACVMHGVDFWAEGRTVERLGLEGLSVKEIRLLVMGVEPSVLTSSASLALPSAAGAAFRSTPSRAL